MLIFGMSFVLLIWYYFCMLRKYSQKEIDNLKKLRLDGYSVDELVSKFLIPKSTVWHHVGNIKISDEKKNILKSRQGGSTKRKELNIEKAKEIAKTMIDASSTRESAVIISMLYWAEGNKKVCEFINSDGKMVELYLFIIRKVIKIEENRIKPTMRIFTGMDEEECLNYWSKITAISKNKFTIRLNDGGTKCGTKYGMCRITIRKGHATLKLLLSLKDCIHDEILKLKMPL